MGDKRDADSDAYTIGQVYAGLPQYNAIATGHAHNPGVITRTEYPLSNAYAGVYSAYPAYAGYAGYHAIGKREADSDAYTIGHVYAGLPLANAIATGHAHNPGVITHTEYPLSNAYAGVYHAAYPAYAGYAGYHAIGKREADSDA